jgi:regulator of sirC expression with transglutaminase-like and TPR domain
VSDDDRLTFRDAVRAAGALSPFRAGLLFAREIAYPDLRPSDYLARLQDAARAARAHLAPFTTIETRKLALAEFLFHSLGLRGNRADYYDPRNSHLNKVLERRQWRPAPRHPPAGRIPRARPGRRRLRRHPAEP